MITISKEEFEKRYGKAVESQPQGKTLVQKLGETVKNRFMDSVSAVDRLQRGEQNFGTTVLQTAGNIAGGLTEAATKTVGAGIGKAAEAVGVAEPIKKLGLELLQTSIGQQALKALGEGMESYEKWKAKNVVLAESIEAVIDIASFIPVAKTAETAVKGTIAGAKMVGRGLETGVKATGQALKTVGTGIEKGYEAAKAITAPMSRIPSNIATNVAAKTAEAQAIKSLPTKIAQTAVRDGLDIKDVKFLTQLPKRQPLLKQLADTAKGFAEGTTKTNPIEIVGKPIVNRIKEIETLRNSVGKQLGAIADKLGKLNQKQIEPLVLDSLKRVPGLQGLTANKGILDFTKTTLATADSLSSRKALQSMFSSAIKSGTGQSKNLLRQELFEILGGKKAAKVMLVGTEEKGYEAIRAGLSKAIASVDKTGQYAAKTTEYAKIMKPLGELRKFMKNVAGAEDDILEMNAGLLARRLTSNAPSNPQLRMILNSLDALTKVQGKTRLSTELLQDFYNLLDKYYGIAGATTLKGQVAAGMNSTGVVNAVKKIAGDLAGETDAVRIKALESVLREILGGSLK